MSDESVKLLNVTFQKKYLKASMCTFLKLKPNIHNKNDRKVNYIFQYVLKSCNLIEFFKKIKNKIVIAKIIFYLIL